jgi:hypothetical protein
MRYLNLVVVAAGLALVAACHDTTIQPPGPDNTRVQHFDSLSAKAKAAGQTNRVAALNLTLRTLADGAIAGSNEIKTGSQANDFVIYRTAVWSLATEVVRQPADSITDSLMVFTSWSGANADTILVVRVGNPKLQQQVNAELATLGLTTTHLTSDTVTADTVTSAALVVGDVVFPADSGIISASYAVFGSACSFVTVQSVTNDSGTQCAREVFDWNFDLRFSPSVRWGLSQTTAAGIVIVR